MGASFGGSCLGLALIGIPREVSWAYLVFGIVMAAGLVMLVVRNDWQRSKGLDKLILFGPIFYAAPLAAFGTEHFTFAMAVGGLIPAWIPWHMFWVYLLGVCFMAAGLSLVTKIQTRLTACLLAFNFFMFVALMDLPGWLRHPESRFGLALALRELSFSGGALALAAALSNNWGERTKYLKTTIARYFVAVPVLYYSVEQFLHADHVPGIPLEMVTPTWLWGHAIWTYVAAVVYLIAGVPLLLNKKTRLAATLIGATVLLVELTVYVPIAIVGRSSLESFNYMADTLMFCGAVLLLAGAMPKESE